jgi:hypothetical protein
MKKFLFFLRLLSTFLGVGYLHPDAFFQVPLNNQQTPSSSFTE